MTPQYTSYRANLQGQSSVIDSSFEPGLEHGSNGGCNSMILGGVLVPLRPPNYCCTALYWDVLYTLAKRQSVHEWSQVEVNSFTILPTPNTSKNANTANTLNQPQKAI